MTYHQAQDYYIQATGIKPIEQAREDWFKYQEDVVEAIGSIMDVSEMVERMGGQLVSRQAIASIIYDSHERSKILDKVYR